MLFLALSFVISEDVYRYDITIYFTATTNKATLQKPKQSKIKRQIKKDDIIMIHLNVLRKQRLTQLTKGFKGLMARYRMTYGRDARAQLGARVAGDMRKLW